MSRWSHGLVIAVISAAALLRSSSAASTSPCKVVAQPHIGLAPVNEVRITATIEPLTVDLNGHPVRQWREARVFLLDEVGEITSSTLFEGDRADTAPRTTQLWLKSLFLGPGVYDVRLHVVGYNRSTCTTFDRITVNGN